MELFRTLTSPALASAKASALLPGPPRAPIVVLHGLFGSSRNWQTIATTLSTRLSRPILCVDLRNHGQSVHYGPEGRPLAHPMTWDLLADDVERLVREVSATAPRPDASPDDGVILMGHSLGGQVIMQSLFRRPALRKHVQHAIMVDISPAPLSRSTPMMDRYLEAMQRIDERQYQTRPEAVDVLRATEGNEMIVQFLFTNYSRLPDGRLGFRLPLAGLQAGLHTLGSTQILPPEPLDLPAALFIKGASSDYIDADLAASMIPQCFRHHRLVEIANAGHWVHHEAPSRFVDALCNYLA